MNVHAFNYAIYLDCDIEILIDDAKSATPDDVAWPRVAVICAEAQVANAVDSIKEEVRKELIEGGDEQMFEGEWSPSEWASLPNSKARYYHLTNKAGDVLAVICERQMPLFELSTPTGGR